MTLFVESVEVLCDYFFNSAQSDEKINPLVKLKFIINKVKIIIMMHEDIPSCMMCKMRIDFFNVMLNMIELHQQMKSHVESVKIV